MTKRKQRVVAYGVVTNHLNINRGVLQGTVLGHILFSIIVSDIKVIALNQNSLVKFADDLIIYLLLNGQLPVNRMQLNFKKTWKILLKGKPTKALPVPLTFIDRKPSLKLLGVTFQSDPYLQ